MTRWAILRSVLAGMTLAGVLAACAGQGTGIAPAPPPASTSNPASSPLPETPLLPYVNDTPQVCYSLAELEALGEGAVARWDTFCFRGDDGSFSVIQQAKAIEAIRLTLNDPTRQVSFQGVTYMPNSPNGDLRTALFRDPRGSDYYVALLANELVEWTPATDGSALSTGTVPQEVLRARAEALVTRGLPSFPDLKPQLQDVSGAKGADHYFFRWEAPACISWTSMPPLAQVGITSGGEVFSYINTLFYCH
jgi:hypothetical protein